MMLITMLHYSIHITQNNNDNMNEINSTYYDKKLNTNLYSLLISIIICNSNSLISNKFFFYTYNWMDIV